MTQAEVHEVDSHFTPCVIVLHMQMRNLKRQTFSGKQDSKALNSHSSKIAKRGAKEKQFKHNESSFRLTYLSMAC